MKQKVLDKFLLNVDVFAFLKKKHVHLAFKLPLSDSDCFNKVINLISNEWEKQEIFFNNYEMIYVRKSSMLFMRPLQNCQNLLGQIVLSKYLNQKMEIFT